MSPVVIVSVQKARLTEEEMRGRLPRIESIPFESEYQYMATLHGSGSDAKMIYIKGAVEAIIARCAHTLTETGEAVIALTGRDLDQLNDDQLAFTYLPAMNALFHSAPIDLDAWWRIPAFAAFAYFLVGVEKQITNRMKKPILLN